MLRFKKVASTVISAVVTASIVLNVNILAATTTKAKVTVPKAVTKVAPKVAPKAKATVPAKVTPSFSKAGSVMGSKNAAKPANYYGTVKITGKGVKFNNAVVNGNLYISGDKVVLTNVKVTKLLTITAPNATINGKFERIEVLKPCNLSITKGSVVKTFVAKANIKLKLDRGASIKNLFTKGFRVATTGSGVVEVRNGVPIGGYVPDNTEQVVIKVQSLSLNKATAELGSGEILQLIAAASPSNADNRSVSWISRDETLALVSPSGLVTANSTGKAGKVDIVAVANDGSGVYAICSVTVKPVKATSFTLGPTNPSVGVGSTLQLVASFTPSNTTNKTIEWTSGDATIATVDSATGVVTGKKVGKVTITGKSADLGTTQTIEVSVTPAKSKAPSASNITVTNNIAPTPDTVVVSGLITGDAVYVYDAATAGNKIGEATAASDGKATISIAQLGKTAGKVYVSVKEITTGNDESDRTAKDYDKETVTVSATYSGNSAATKVLVTSTNSPSITQYRISTTDGSQTFCTKALNSISTGLTTLVSEFKIEFLDAQNNVVATGKLKFNVDQSGNVTGSITLE